MNEIGQQLTQAGQQLTEAIERAEKIVDKGPAKALQILGVVLIFGATIVRFIATIRGIYPRFEFTTLDFLITMISGLVLFFGGAAVSLYEYTTNTRLYEAEINEASQNQSRAFEVMAKVAEREPPSPTVKPSL